jgi:hypothetical protein
MLADDFSGAVRKLGQDYYWRGLVHIEHGSESAVKALIRGPQSYRVALDWEPGGALVASCSCTSFEMEGPCKHLWATILAAEERHHLALAASSKDLFLDDSGIDAEELFNDPEGYPDAPPPPGVALAPPPPKAPAWQKRVAEVSSLRAFATAQSYGWPAKRQIVYIVEVAKSMLGAGIVLTIETRDRKVDGNWTRNNTLNLKHHQIADLPLLEDREILSALSGTRQHYSWSYSDSYETIPACCAVKHPLASMVMPLIVRTGRCYLRLDNRPPEDYGPLTWDEGGPWRFALQMRRREHAGWIVEGILRRGEETIGLSAPAVVTKGGLLFIGDRVAALAEDTPFEWLSYLRKTGCIEAPKKDQNDFLAALLSSPGLPPLEVPEELRYEEVALQPDICLRVRAADPASGRPDRLRAKLSFEYEGRSLSTHEHSRGWYEADNRRFLRRDRDAERTAVALLTELGARFQGPIYRDPEPAWEIAPTKLPRIVPALLAAGWHVEADGKTFRHPGAFRMEVSSGVDWFELHGEVDYGESKAQLPELLQALRRGENMVRLDNGEYGMLPEDWLRRFGPVAGLGTLDDGHLRFRPSQAGLLDALLATQPEARCDETFARIRKELGQFQGVEAAEQPSGFVGQLRDYQREGLGWMHFLRRFSFGGCLADDMGVGKTAQVLALLEGRRQLKNGGNQPGPSLVVVPKSLVFNWKLEAGRFTPQLRVLDYTGLSRSAQDFSSYDIVLTTYGTLRRDALRLKDVAFDYVVLDEAQAIKNASTESAKAVRLLRGDHRLALSGTPMENHLGELWTLFEFLNPGMLGAASAFKMAGGPTRNPDEETRKLLASALRPFILRRTKEQVARELPSKNEQTLYCEMGPAQRKLYNDLLQHYRNSLLKRIETEGLAKSKIQVLEALLRLRQAACHPGLLDPKRTGDPSAKLEMLLEQLTEVLAEGRKALVFSQFTSLLAIVRQNLDARGITYEYLDGKTHDRQARVEHFQNDADCRLFLISLKAGGLGLNLTAAEYVFLLDPWWNPAVEAQAVDRAHRIGQTRQVFAYRLIARDTIEEKVLQLQETKRDLAAAIIGADNSLIRNLQREDLEILLS